MSVGRTTRVVAMGIAIGEGGTQRETEGKEGKEGETVKSSESGVVAVVV